MCTVSIQLYWMFNIIIYILIVLAVRIPVLISNENVICWNKAALK